MTVSDEVSDWTSAISDLASVAISHPQSAYAGLQKSLQQEWQSVQRVVEGMGDDLSDLEKAITDLFLPSLFADQYDESDPRHNLSKLPVKFAGLALPDPVASSDNNFEASTLVCSHLLAAFRGVEPFSSEEHLPVQKTVIAELKVRKTALNEFTLDSILKGLDCDTRRTILQGKETGQWLSVMPSTLNGTELSPQEFRDSLHLRYSRTPGDLPTHCDGCDAKFSIRHALECKVGDLIIMRHNEVNDELGDLASNAMTPSAVQAEPLISKGSTANEINAQDALPPVQCMPHPNS
jgi:hypothetical protein